MSKEPIIHKKSNFDFKSIVVGIFIGFVAYYAYSSVFAEPTLENVTEILAAVPDSINVSKSSYVLRAVQFNARIQDELDRYNNESKISEAFQVQLASFKSECPDDTIKGVNFEIIPLISSLLEGQNVEIQDLTLNNYGIYVAFGKYPNHNEISTPLPIDQTEYINDYQGRRTLFINYTRKDNSTFEFLNNSANERLGDNLGKVCPRYCPE